MNYRITTAPLADEALNNDGSVTLLRSYSKAGAYTEMQKFPNCNRWFFAGYPEVTIERCEDGEWIPCESFTLSM